MTYKLQKDPMTGKIDAVNKIEENKLISIPFNESNRHYREYLEWLAEGNEPEPADEV